MGNYKSPEDQKEYNRKYREQNKATIKAKLQQKEECQHCKRCVSHQNMQSHLKSTYCSKRRMQNTFDLYKYAKTIVISYENGNEVVNSDLEPDEAELL